MTTAAPERKTWRRRQREDDSESNVPQLRPGQSSVGDPQIAHGRLWYVDENNELQADLHEGQSRAWQSTARYVAVIAGSQAGKTSYGPLWLWREIQTRGPGDYMVVTPTHPLAKLKALPEFLRLFRDTLHAGEYQRSDKVFKFRDGETNVFFGMATNPESLESATAKAVWCDEAGQVQFHLESWEAIERRLALNMGRALITTTPYNCYSEDTEIYTRRGWRRFDQLQDVDEVLACDPKTRAAAFEKPSEIFWQRHTGPMIRMQGSRLDLLVTPNHRVAYRRGPQMRVATAEQFATMEHRWLSIPTTVNLTNEAAPGTFTLPAVNRSHLASAPSIDIPMGAWCAFMGWFLTEGSADAPGTSHVRAGDYRVTISQQPGLKRERLRADLARLPFRWSEDRVGFSTNNKQLWTYLGQFGKADAKYIPDDVKRASRPDLLEMIDRMVLGDGTYRHKRQGEFVFYSISEQLASGFKEVCMLAGISTHMAPRRVRSHIKGHLYEYTMFHVTDRRRKSAMVARCESVDYDGWIGCVRVSTGFVMVRRNGHEAISGNTGWLLHRIVKPWQDGDPDIDVINFPSVANPAFPKEADERQRRVLPDWKYQMFYRGKIVSPAGMIYGDSYNDDWWLPDGGGHVVKPFYIPPSWPRYVGVDFGGANTAIIWIAHDIERDVFIVYREAHRGGLSASQHVERFRQESYGENIARVWGGSKGESQQRLEWQQAGLWVEGPPDELIAQGGVEESIVEAGIGRIIELWRTRRLLVFSNLMGLRSELGAYARKLDPLGNPTNEILDKKKWHRLDALRYVGQNLSGPLLFRPIFGLTHAGRIGSGGSRRRAA